MPIQEWVGAASIPYSYILAGRVTGFSRYLSPCSFNVPVGCQLAEGVTRFRLSRVCSATGIYLSCARPGQYAIAVSWFFSWRGNCFPFPIPSTLPSELQLDPSRCAPLLTPQGAMASTSGNIFNLRGGYGFVAGGPSRSDEQFQHVCQMVYFCNVFGIDLCLKFPSIPVCVFDYVGYYLVV